MVRGLLRFLAANHKIPLGLDGEIGLTGELRYVAHPERRTAEAHKFGLSPVATDGRNLRAVLQAVLSGRAREPAAA